jgi:hypothetical protein
VLCRKAATGVGGFVGIAGIKQRKLYHGTSRLEGNWMVHSLVVRYDSHQYSQVRLRERFAPR